MKIIILSDGETWETFGPESDAQIVELLNIPDNPDLEDIEEALAEDRFETINYIWDMV